MGRGVDLVVIGAGRECRKFPDQLLDLAVAAEQVVAPIRVRKPPPGNAWAANEYCPESFAITGAVTPAGATPGISLGGLIG